MMMDYHRMPPKTARQTLKDTCFPKKSSKQVKQELAENVVQSAVLYPDLALKFWDDGVRFGAGALAPVATGLLRAVQVPFI